MSETSTRGFPRPIDATLHGATDYQRVPQVAPCLFEVGRREP